MSPDPGPVFVLATGAGQAQSSPAMSAWAARLRALGPVVPFDWPYLAAGRKRPDRPEVLLAAHRAALAAARAAHPGRPVVLAGRSMGGRLGCHLSLEAPVRALVCLAYPLLSPTGARRDEVLLALRTPALFVQGTRDDKAPLDDLRGVLARMAAPAALHVVETGDHALSVTAAWRRAAGRTQDDVDRGIVDAIAAFLAALPPEEAP